MSVIPLGPARTTLSLGLCAAVVAGLVYVASRDGAKPAVEIAAAPVDAQPEAAAAPVDAQPAVVAPEPVAEAAAKDPPAATAEAPSVDVVRVAPDGAAVVAGRAAPGSTVTIFADEERLAEAKTDDQGNFVAIFTAEPSAEPRALTLGSETAGGEKAVSDQVVLLLPEAPGREPASTTASTTAAESAATADDTDVAAAPGGNAEGEDPTLDATETVETEMATPEVAATAILSGDSVEITPLARPIGAAANRVSLASISYADKGEVKLAGFGLAGSPLRAYVDDMFARDGMVEDDGRWTIALRDVAAGLYRLRVDQLSADGRVSSRIETPFKRDFPQPRPASGEGVAPLSVVVQPGSNLWTLARIHYGSGVLYTQIFAANSDLIADPSLIYPGQIFRLPEKQAEQ